MGQSKIDISKYSYLWTSELSNHVLLKTGQTRNGVPELIIYNVVHKTATVIENNAEALAVREEMLKHGCQIVEPNELV